MITPTVSVPEAPRFNLGRVTALLLLAVALLLFAGGMPLPLVGMVYVLAFWLAAWTAPHLALMLIFCATPFQQDLSGGGAMKFSIAEINLLLTLPVFVIRSVLRRRLFLRSPIAIPILLYLVVGCIASAPHWRGMDALRSLVQMVLYLVIAVTVFASFARKEEHLLTVLNALAVVGVILAGTLLVQGENYVLGLHKNGLGGSMACAVIVTAELWFAASGRRKQVLLCALMWIAAGLIFTLSRGAWLGAITGLLLIVLLRGQFSILARAGLVLAIVVPLCWHFLPQEKRAYATNFDAKQDNIGARYQSIEQGRAYFLQNPLLGAGIGLRKSMDATNVVVFTLAESGVLGLAAFVLIHLAFFRMLWSVQRGFKRTDPLYSLLAVGGALVLSKFAHGMVDHYWSRGHLLMAWSAAGMAIGVYRVARARQIEDEQPVQEVVARSQSRFLDAPSASIG